MPPLPAPLCAAAVAPASAPLYLALLPSALLAEVDRLIAINTWRADGVALMKLNLPPHAVAYAPEYKRFMLATGEELLVTYGLGHESALILEPGTQAVKTAVILGRFKAFLPAQRDIHEDLVLTADLRHDRELRDHEWFLYTITEALSNGAPLIKCPLKPRLVGERSSYFTWTASICGEWFQAGPDFYRLPLMQHHVHEPAALSCVPYDACTVLGAPEKERFWLITDHSSSEHVLAAYDFRTGTNIYKVHTDTPPERWCFLWPDQLMGALYNITDRSVQLYSLVDGSPIPHTDAADAAAILAASPPPPWKRARRRAKSILLSTDSTPPVLWDFSAEPRVTPSLHTASDDRFVAVSVGAWQHPARHHLRHVSVPADALAYTMHSDAVFFLHVPAMCVALALRATCCVLRAVCYFQRAACSVLCAV